MKVVGYLHNADLLLEDDQGVAIIGGSRYVLSMGDEVFIHQMLDEKAKLYLIKISFANAEHSLMHEDEIQLKFEGCRDQLQQYLHSSTVH